jgi:hypothetical protein
VSGLPTGCYCPSVEKVKQHFVCRS